MIKSMKDLPSPGIHDIKIIVDDMPAIEKILQYLEKLGWLWWDGSKPTSQLEDLGKSDLYLGSSSLSSPYLHTIKNNLHGEKASVIVYGCEIMGRGNGRCPRCNSPDIIWSMGMFKCNSCWNTW